MDREGGAQTEVHRGRWTVRELDRGRWTQRELDRGRRTQKEVNREGDGQREVNKGRCAKEGAQRAEAVPKPRAAETCHP